MTANVIFKAEDIEGISLLVRPHCDHCPVTPVCRCIRPVAGKEKSNQVKISLHEISVVSRKAEAGTRVDGEAVANVDRALHRLDDEDDGDQAGEALLCEPSDVADKEAAEKEVTTDSEEGIFAPGIRGDEYDEHGSKPESNPDAKGQVFPAKAQAELINLKYQPDKASFFPWKKNG